MTAREVIKRLLEAGFSECRPRRSGSHRHFAHPERPGKITVPEHKGDLKPGTLKSIEKQSGVKLS